MTEQRKKSNWVKGLADAVNMVTTAAAAIGLCGYLGYWLDGRFHNTNNVFLILGVLLGVATGIKSMWDKMQANEKRKSSENNNNPE